jgi:hypothetical protein
VDDVSDLALKIRLHPRIASESLACFWKLVPLGLLSELADAQFVQAFPSLSLIAKSQ